MGNELLNKLEKERGEGARGRKKREGVDTAEDKKEKAEGTVEGKGKKGGAAASQV